MFLNYLRTKIILQHSLLFIFHWSLEGNTCLLLVEENKNHSNKSQCVD